jgi:hypothetical protein
MIFKLLNKYDYFNECEEIEIAKGKNRLPLTMVEGIKQMNRKRKYKQ